MVICSYHINGPYTVLWACPCNETPLPQRPSAANSYYNPLAARVHHPVPASGFSHICTYVCTNNLIFFIFFYIKQPKTSKIYNKAISSSPRSDLAYQVHILNGPYEVLSFQNITSFQELFQRLLSYISSTYNVIIFTKKALSILNSNRILEYYTVA